MNQDQRAVFNAAYRIGSALNRKFEVSDMTVELRQAARLYAATYEGDFDYMTAMRDQVALGEMFFSDGQSKAILNCLMADAKRRLADKEKPKAPAEQPVNLMLDPETGALESADELLDLAAASRIAPVSRQEAIARGRARTYDEIFGEDS
jgi:hypothetical protein